MNQYSISLKPFVFVLAVFLFISTAAFATDPIPGVDVHLGKPPGGQVFMTATTETNGKFTFEGLDPGSYEITFTAKEGLALNETKHNGTVETGQITIDQADGVTVDGKRQWGPITISSSQTTVIKITLSGKGNISGKITEFAIKENGVK